MEEEKVSFGTAKLAKEKGFNILVYDWYDTRENRLLPEYPIEWKSSIKKDFNNLEPNQISRPTQDLLQRWLREVHNIHIFAPSKTINGKTVFIPCGRTIPDTVKNNLIVDLIPYSVYNSHEEALEIGLQEALKLIKRPKS